MTKRIVSTLVKLAVTAGLFVLLFRPETYGLRYDLFGDITPKSLLDELRAADATGVTLWLTFAALIKLAGMLAGVFRWQLLLVGQGLEMPFWYMVQSWFVGRFFGIFLPGTIGLDGYRLYDSSMYTKEPIKSATVIAVEKLIGFISLTFLVFLTFPLGFRLLRINVPTLAALLAALGVFVAASFLLLLNPRVVQVLVAVFPTPGAIRGKVDKLGAAITAYSGQRALLVKAVVLGLCVHVATCFMYFGTMMAIRAGNTSLWDILFASPLMIYGTVIGPSVGGEGIRELVFATLLGGKSGVAIAVLFAHLGWWMGDFIPFLIGAAVFGTRSRPSKEQLAAELDAARKQAARAEASTTVHLAPGAVAEYRRKLLDVLGAGLLGGAIAGAIIGLAEAGYISHTLKGLPDASALWWGPLVYGLLFVVPGLALAAFLLFCYLLNDRFLPAAVTFGLCFGGTLASGGVIALWRFMRDVLEERAPGLLQVLGFAAISLGVGVLAALLGASLARLVRRRLAAAGAGALVIMLLVAGGAAYGARLAAGVAAPSFSPAAHATGPNIILIAIDALRADYLKLYANDAVPDTPRLDEFARDSVFFKNAFAQASWTKPSFATIFSSRYPESHTATGNMSPLPESIVTFPELLLEQGYYTQGFANNPNIGAHFGFDQGFVDYTFLKPRAAFFAGPSASKLTGYEILRRVKTRVLRRFSDRVDVTEAYQPAPVVTRDALAWLDSAGRPKDAPFFLFLHYMDPHDPFMDHTRPGVGYARVRMNNPDPDRYLVPMRDAYYSEIEYLDEHLGALFDGLRQRGLYDGAVILFTSDHGEEFYDHEGWWHGQTLFDELIHVPLLIKLPGNALAGLQNTDFARHLDIGPTLLHFAGAGVAPEMSGKALFAADGSFTNGDIRFVYAENDFENNVLQSVRTRDAKVIHANPDNPRRHAPKECYDLVADPGEHTNLAAGQSCRPELEQLLAEMTRFVQGTAAEPALAATVSEETKRQLESLGYLE